MARRLFTLVTQGNISTIQELFQALPLPLENEELEALLEIYDIENIDIDQYNKCEVGVAKDMMAKIQGRLRFYTDPVGREQLSIALQALRLTKETTQLAEEVLKLARENEQRRNLY